MVERRLEVVGEEDEIMVTAISSKGWEKKV